MFALFLTVNCFNPILDREVLPTTYMLVKIGIKPEMFED